MMKSIVYTALAILLLATSNTWLGTYAPEPVVLKMTETTRYNISLDER
jgi:hypothetical protein